MNRPDTTPVAHFRGHTCRDLYNSIFDAESPEQVVRQLPAQTLFMVVKDAGLNAASELLSMASLEQTKLLTDFDLWSGDTLNEEALWEWLALTDDTDSLELLQKFIKIVDLKLLAILIGKYVEVKVFEEPTEQPPGPGFHTPDKGFTWIGISMESADKHFLLARLLALIFESSAELFYQLISVVTVATVSMLEEESYQERMKRLAAEGIPEPEVAAAIHAPYSMAEARVELGASFERKPVEDLRAIEPLLYESRATKLLAELVRDVSDREELETEFTYIMNGAVVRWGIDFCNQESVVDLAERVKGAINIGLEKISRELSTMPVESYKKLGLGKLYRLGVTELLALRSKARKFQLDSLGSLSESEPALFTTVACAREAFPVMPIFLNDDGSIEREGESLQSGQRPFSSMHGVETVLSMLAKVSELTSDKRS
jgi:hypothetical protein